MDAAQVSGDDDNEDGVVYGHQDRDNHYDAAISGDGDARILAKDGGGRDPVVAFGPSEAIDRGNAINHLRLEVEEGTLSFHVNGQLVFQESDYRFGEGQIGLGCSPFSQPGLHCASRQSAHLGLAG